MDDDPRFVLLGIVNPAGVIFLGFDGPFVITIANAIDELIADEDVVDMEFLFVRGFVGEGIDQIEVLIQSDFVDSFVIHLNRPLPEKEPFEDRAEEKNQENRADENGADDEEAKFNRVSHF